MGWFSLLTDSPVAICLGVVAFGLSVWTLQTIIAYRKLRQFDGPFLASISRLWLIRAGTSGRQHALFADVCEKYGPVVRVGPSDLMTTDLELLQRINAARSNYLKSDFYSAFKFNPDRHNLVSEIDPKRHDWLRYRLAPGYTGKEVPTMEKDIDDCVEDLIKLIKQTYISTSTNFQKMDFGRVAQYFTLDVISALAFGKKFGFLENNEDVFEYIRTTEENLPAMTFIALVPALSNFIRLPWIWALLGPSTKDKLGLGKILGVAKEIVGERFGPDKKVQEDMLGSFIRRGLSQADCEGETMIQIMAGSDTTATAVRATLLNIVTHPHVYVKLQQEIDLAVKENRISKTIITNAEAKQLPYLQAVIKEGLRIWPPLVGFLAKVATKEGDTFRGRFIPEGTRVGWAVWGIAQSVEVFGEDAKMFRPERWLEAAPEQRARMDKTHDFIFGSGKYGCLGKTVAFIELNKVFVELLRRFDLSIVDAANPWNSVDVGIFTQSGMYLRVTERSGVE